MSKPDDIPQGVWDSTEGVRISFVNPDPDEVREAVARGINAERESGALRNIANTAEHASAAVFLEQERCAGAASELTFDAHELAQASEYGRGMDHAARTILAAIRTPQPSPPTGGQ